MKKLLVALATVIVLVGCAKPVNPEFWEPVAVSYQITNKDGQGYCSATKVGPETLLTAEHCIGDLADLYIRAKNGALVPAKVLRKDPINDLALLSAEVYGPNARILGVAPILGDEVLAVGFPLGVGPVLTKGFWSVVVGQEQFPTITRKFNMISAPITSGNSGGGIFIKYNGRWYLTGVLQAVMLNNQLGFPQFVSHLALISHFPDFKAFLK